MPLGREIVGVVRSGALQLLLDHLCHPLQRPKLHCTGQPLRKLWLAVYVYDASLCQLVAKSLRCEPGGLRVSHGQHEAAMQVRGFPAEPASLHRCYASLLQLRP